MKSDLLTHILLGAALLVPMLLNAQQTRKVEAEIIHVRDKFSVGRAPNVHHFGAVEDTITAGSTHAQIPTAKAVWDLFQTAPGGLDTVHTTARLTGIGTPGEPLDIAQQGATAGQVLKWDGTAWMPADDDISGGGGGGHVIAVDEAAVVQRDTLNFQNTGEVEFLVANSATMTNVTANIAQQGATIGQVLRWNGSAWFPHGTNMYDVVTSSQTVGEQYNQVFVDTLTAPITLNLPPCNAANDGVKFEIVKSGSDTHAVHIEPAGSELFNDDATTKTLYNRGTALVCTCRWMGAVGKWHYISM